MRQQVAGEIHYRVRGCIIERCVITLGKIINHVQGSVRPVLIARIISIPHIGGAVALPNQALRGLAADDQLQLVAAGLQRVSLPAAGPGNLHVRGVASKSPKGRDNIGAIEWCTIDNQFGGIPPSDAAHIQVPRNHQQRIGATAGRVGVHQIGNNGVTSGVYDAAIIGDGAGARKRTRIQNRASLQGHIAIQNKLAGVGGAIGNGIVARDRSRTGEVLAAVKCE